MKQLLKKNNLTKTATLEFSRLVVTNPLENMLQVKRVKRAINGVLLLDKPHGISSNGALQQVKRIYQAAKAGHTGNLDPIATGLLPVCLGEATKFSQYLLDANKTYQARFKLGQTTTTGDSEGEILTKQPVNVTLAQIEAVLLQFSGKMLQIPPMYSALKHQGKALYTYARAGVEIERKAREVNIYSIQLDEFVGDELAFTVACSKGTYIRVLGEDIAKVLGCGAHMIALRRTIIGEFRIENALTIPQLDNMTMQERDAQLLAPDCLVSGLPSVELDVDSAYYFMQGQSVWKAKQNYRGQVRVYDAQHDFLGIAEITDEGKVAPKRLIVKNISE